MHIYKIPSDLWCRVHDNENDKPQGFQCGSA